MDEKSTIKVHMDRTKNQLIHLEQDQDSNNRCHFNKKKLSAEKIMSSFEGKDMQII